jgi:protein gp37
MSRRGYAPMIGNITEREWEAPYLVNRQLDQAQMRQADETCPRHPNSQSEQSRPGEAARIRRSVSVALDLLWERGLMAKTTIQWTDESWNPVTGCSHVSPGCEHCYAERISLRRKWSLKPWTAPNASENVILHPERLEQPLHWRKPRLVFVNSMSDLFHELVPDAFIARVFQVMAKATKHTFQVLTKRPQRMFEWLIQCGNGHGLGWITHDGTPPAGAYEGTGIAITGTNNWPLPNVWLGISVEDQRRAEERIPLLMSTPAAVRFISAEPLLKDLHLTEYLRVFRPTPCDTWPNSELEYNPIGWVIIGGESGPQARPMDLEWALDLVDQCQRARVPVFVKQLSQNGNPHYQDFETFPQDLRIRQYPRNGGKL